MPNFWTHVKTSFFMFPILILGWEYFHPFLNTLGIKIVNNPLMYILGFSFFVIGSDLPDIDHQDAIIHKIVRMLLMILISASSFYLLFESQTISSFFSDYSNRFIIPLYWLISVLVGFLSGELFVILKAKHRGVIHSPVTSIFYGILVFIFIFGILSLQKAIFPSISAFFGYNLHLGMDKIF